MEPQTLALAVITLLAAFVNGALGYGFSSITVPIALLFLTNRILNPALILIEVVLNAYVLWNNREAFSTVWRRVAPMVIGLMPGIAVGTAVVSATAYPVQFRSVPVQYPSSSTAPVSAAPAIVTVNTSAAVSLPATLPGPPANAAA